MTHPHAYTNTYSENRAPPQCYPPHPPVPISNYSSLAGALEPTSSPQKSHAHKSSSGTSGHSNSTPTKGVLANVQPSSSRRRVANPDPNPGAYFSTFSVTPPVQPSNTRRPGGPSNHFRLPQPHAASSRSSASGLHPAINFQLCQFEEAGIRLADTLVANPPIRGANDQVWSGYAERQIEVHIIWPGYSKYSFQKRLKLGNQTRSELLTIISSLIMEFAQSMKKGRVSVESGYEAYAIGQKPDGSKGLEGHQCFLTALVHRGGFTWQPEIFIPKYPHLAV